jgi:hypothetical protein
MAFAVSAGVCSAGRIGTVATAFGLVAAVGAVVVCACAEIPVVMHINVAVSIDLMTTLGSIAEFAIKHICLVGDSGPGVHGNRPVRRRRPEEMIVAIRRR